MRNARWFALLCLAAVGAAQEQRSFIGSDSCRRCHAKQHAGQRRSAHAASLHAAEQHPLLSAILDARTGSRPPDYNFEFVADSGGLWIAVAHKNQKRKLKIDWAFGAGSQGVTFVSKFGPQAYLEHSLTYYPRKNGFALTPAHENVRPESLEAALGIAFQTYGPGGEIVECFQCHSTGPVEISVTDEIQPWERGIGCEACHGPGSTHRALAQAGEVAKAVAAIDGRRRMSGIEANQFCGRCHRAQIQGKAAVDLTYAWNVRHQPPYLQRSACFEQSSGGLSCITCHDPHAPLERSNMAHYDRACRSCHGSSARIPAKACRDDCASCHMPRVEVGWMQFRNHRIGVYAAGAIVPLQR